MKTSLMILAALSLGTAAAAQDTSMQPGATAPVPTAAPTMPDQQSPATAPTTPAPADTAAPAPADTSANSSMTAPAATADATTPQPATTDYPTCSRSVTDKCVQKGAAHRMHRK